MIARRWLRRGARGLRRTLQPQQQLDQLLAAQPLKITAPHPTKESAKPSPRKGVGNYDWLADIAADLEPEDGLIWVYDPQHPDGTMAFSEFGIASLCNLIEVHRSTTK